MCTEYGKANCIEYWFVQVVEETSCLIWLIVSNKVLVHYISYCLWVHACHGGWHHVRVVYLEPNRNCCQDFVKYKRESFFSNGIGSMIAYYIKWVSNF